MRKYFDKTILLLYYIFLVIGFFLTVIELPNILNDIFNTKIFTGTQTLSFLFCSFIFGYSILYLNETRQVKQLEEKENYYQKRKELEEKRNKKFKNEDK